VFCYVSQKLALEGCDKTWDQCRIKLKNLKSQYRYVKDRIPNIDEVDLEDDEILKQLIAECQGRGISPSNIKHLRDLKRFLQKSSEMAKTTLQNALEVRNEILGPGVTISNTSTVAPIHGPSRVERSLLSTDSDSNLMFEENESNPGSSGEQGDEDSELVTEPFVKKKKKESLDDLKPLLNGSMLDGYKYMEKFNREMMDQFMEFQKRYNTSYVRWEQERLRQEQLALEQWRQEAREHEKQMFGMFCSTISHCNAALNTLLKAKNDAQDEVKRLKVQLKGKNDGTAPVFYTADDD